MEPPVKDVVWLFGWVRGLAFFFHFNFERVEVLAYTGLEYVGLDYVYLGVFGLALMRRVCRSKLFRLRFVSEAFLSDVISVCAAR